MRKQFHSATRTLARLDDHNVCTGIAAMGSRLVNLCSGTTISFRETNV